MSPTDQGGRSASAARESFDAYARAGVDVAAADRAVELMRTSVKATLGPEALGALGGFAGLWDATALKDYDQPILVTSTDGVGTKLAIAQAMDIHDTVGYDLVGMVVDDVVVTGAKPLFMTDYIATGKVDPARIAAVVAGIAAACEHTGTALLGGETAEHPGLMGPSEYDIAGAAVGVVERSELLGPDRVGQGDVVLGLASSGLHSNGFSLVRAVVRELGWAWDRPVAEFGRTLGEELLEPTRLYTRSVLALARRLGNDLHALAHVTGGGLAANLSRVLPAPLGAVVSRASWPVPPVFQLLGSAGHVTWLDLERSLNMGIGMAAVVAEPALGAASAALAELGEQAVPIGRVALAADVRAEAENRGARAEDLTQGAKGVEGGAVLLIDEYHR
ncbi:MAG: phosphoribosylformylglycinamidine cyclo-ligase [Bifidobacteriaceae bacterium]|jgi:phosphoribosylformylglycinamidine cyclo-ligase|nr:phosphoribosylformylglycinamidine cyclo-ligase [Bifidobacteriaceae bacterium]